MRSPQTTYDQDGRRKRTKLAPSAQRRRAQSVAKSRRGRKTKSKKLHKQIVFPPPEIRDVHLTSADLSTAVAVFELRQRDAAEERVYRWLVGERRLAQLREVFNDAADTDGAA